MSIDAALRSGSRCYFFSGDQYIRVKRGDTGAGTLDAGYPRPIGPNWGWPAGFGAGGIDAALYSGSRCYFFSGDEYIRVTRGETGPGTVDPGYPASISNWGWPAGFGASASGLRVRRAVGSPAAATDIATYAQGVAAMRARSAANPADPLGWEYFSHIHGNPQANGPLPGDPPDWSTCQHGSWFFVVWHRMYLLQLERIIGAETGVADFALPYWDYADASAVTSIPPPFGDPGSPLFDATRNFRPRAFAAPTWASATSYSAFGGALQAANHLGGSPGALELNPHNFVHGIVGGDMAGFQSPLDPLFFIHHCAIDRFAEQWLNMAGHALPSSTSWTGSSFDFPDPVAPGGRRSIDVSEVVTTETAGYRYDDVPSATVAADFGLDTLDVVAGRRRDDELRLLSATAGGGDVTESVALELPAFADEAFAADAPAGGGEREHPLYLVLENVGIEGGDASSMWDVFVRTTSGRELVGTISPFGLAGLTGQRGRQTITFDITAIADRLAPGPVEVSFEAAYPDVEHRPHWERVAFYTTEG